MTCKQDGDVAVRHNALRMFLPNFVIGLGWVGNILVPNWLSGKPAAFDLTVVSPLNSKTLNEAGATGGQQLVMSKLANLQPMIRSAES